MQHQTIEADRDLDLEQALEDMLPRARRVRDLTIRMLEHDEGSRARTSLQGDIQEQMSFVLLRAERLNMAGDAFMLLLNAELDAKARRGRPAPTRDTSRTLLAQHEQAQARLKEARDQEKAWAERVEEELAAISATEKAIAALGARGLR